MKSPQTGRLAASPKAAEALMLVTQDGAIRCATPLGLLWLDEHFGAKTHGKRLPLDLQRWLAKPQGNRGQCRPFTKENDHARLVVSLLHPEADKTFALLFQKRDLDAARTRLRHYRITDREHEVLAVMAEGKTNLQIADEFGISESTVKRHVEHILEKFNVDNRAAAVAVWQRMLDKAFGAT